MRGDKRPSPKLPSLAVQKPRDSQIGNVAAPFLNLRALIAPSTHRIYASGHLLFIDIHYNMMGLNFCGMWIFSEGCSKQLPSIFSDLGGIPGHIYSTQLLHGPDVFGCL